MNNDEKISWMRRLGVVQAAWSADGALSSCMLGPEPVPEDDRAPAPRRDDSYEDQENQKRAELGLPTLEEEEILCASA